MGACGTHAGRLEALFAHRRFTDSDFKGLLVGSLNRLTRYTFYYVAHTPPPTAPLPSTMDCCSTHARRLSGPPSTRAAIAMDGGVADTACFYTGR